MTATGIRLQSTSKTTYNPRTNSIPTDGTAQKPKNMISLRARCDASLGLLKLVEPFYVDPVSRVRIVAARLEDDQLFMEVGIDPNLLACCGRRLDTVMVSIKN